MSERDDLWNQYTKTSSPALREKIILQNVPLVRYVMGRLALPELGIDVYNDLVSQGILGLIDAVDRFEPKRGLRFSTYAALRIRGHILDALRAMDILPRGARKRVKEIERTAARLRMKLGREPRDTEVATATNLDLKAYYTALVEANCTILSLDSPLDGSCGENAFSLRDFLCDRDSPSPEESVEEAESQQRLFTALRRLPQRTQLLLALYYYEGLTMKEIGQVLDLTESRVSQIHTRAMLRLRVALEHDQAALRPMLATRSPRCTATPVFASG